MLQGRVGLTAGACAAAAVLGAMAAVQWVSWPALPVEAELESVAPVAASIATNPVPMARAKRSQVRTEGGDAKANEKGTGVQMAAASVGEPAERLARLLAQLNTRVARLEEEVRRQGEHIYTLRTAAEPVDPLDVDDATIAAIEAEEARLREEDALRIEDRNREIEAAFELQGVDPEWSTRAIREISEALTDQPIEDAYVTGLECRSSLCRLEVETIALQAQTELEIALAGLAAAGKPSIALETTAAPDGTVTSVLYIVREGYSLL